jgi:nitrate reductase NapE component
MLGYSTLGMVRVARKEAERLNPWITFTLLALVLAPGVALALAVKK